MLLDLDPRLQRRRVVGGLHGDGDLRDDRATVEAGVDEVDRRPRQLDPVRDRLRRGVRAGKRRIGQKAGDSSMGGIGDPVAASG